MYIVMESDSVISLEDEVLEFLLTWNSVSQGDMGSPGKVLASEEVTWSEDKVLVDEDAVQGDGNVLVDEKTTWSDSKVYPRHYGVHGGRFPTATTTNPSCSKLSAGKDQPQRTHQCGVKRHPGVTTSPINDAHRSSYVAELKACWPSKYKKLKRDMEEARKNM